MKPNDTVLVTYWNAQNQRHEECAAILDYYRIDADCWYFKQPCPLVWAYADDIAVLKVVGN